MIREITINSAQAGDIKWISLVRNGVTTHSFDNGQRLVNVPIVSQTGGKIRARLTGNRNLAPPGWYMLFLVNRGRCAVYREVDPGRLKRPQDLSRLVKLYDCWRNGHNERLVITARMWAASDRDSKDRKS